MDTMFGNTLDNLHDHLQIRERSLALEKSIETSADVNNLKKNFAAVSVITHLVETQNKEDLSFLGFDRSLFPVMQMFAERGPRVYGTFAHPGECDLYKIVASTRLVEEALSQGVPLDSIMTLQLETKNREIPSAERPLGINNLGPTTKKDPFGIETVNPQSFEEIVELFTKQLHTQVDDQLAELQISKKLKGIIRDQIKSNLEGRLGELMSIKPNYINNNHIELQRNMMNFNVNLANLILKDSPEPEVAKEIVAKTGTEIFLDSGEYRRLIVDSLKMIIDIKGIDVVKNLVENEKSKGLLKIILNESVFELTVNENKKFIMHDGRDFKVLIEDSEFTNLLEHSVVLGKLEALALVAGGQTIHAGSAHGSIAKALDVLKIKGKARQYIENLSFGHDHSQGHEGVRLNNTFVPLPLQFLMLGSRNLQEIIHGEEITTKTLEDLKLFFAKKLVNEAINMLPIEI